MNIKKEKYVCLCCGYKTLEAYTESTEYSICVLCGWQDDSFSWEKVRLRSILNNESLWKAQQMILMHGFPYFWKKHREEQEDEEDYEIEKDWEPFEKNYWHLR